MPKRSMKDNKAVYPCPFPGCTVECSTRANTWTHIHREHLKVVLVCPICDNPMLSMVSFKTHMKQVHTGVQEAVQEASGGPSTKRLKTQDSPQN